MVANTRRESSTKLDIAAQGSVNDLWSMEFRVFACFMPLQGYSGGLGGPHASEPGVSTVLQGGVLGWRRYTTALQAP